MKHRLLNSHCCLRISLAIVTICGSGLIWFSSVEAVQESAPGPGDYEEQLEIDGRMRTFDVHVPAGVDSSQGLPVLIALHGGGGNAAYMERKSGFSDLADEETFIVVYPNGTGLLENRLTWNVGNCCGYAHRNDVDDVGFIAAVLDVMGSEYGADMHRVYLTGHSNGGMMTYRLACQMADRFAAVAPVAGALNEATCTPSRPLPVLILHGEDDLNVPFHGGTSQGVGAAGEDERIDQPVSYAVETWTAIDGCNDPAEISTTESVITTTYGDCIDGTTVEMQELLGWGHAWPSPTADPPAAIDASRVIWAFFERFEMKAS